MQSAILLLVATPVTIWKKSIRWIHYSGLQTWELFFYFLATFSILPTPLMFSNKTHDSFEKKKGAPTGWNVIHAHLMTGCCYHSTWHPVTSWNCWGIQITNISTRIQSDTNGVGSTLTVIMGLQHRDWPLHPSYFFGSFSFIAFPEGMGRV